MSSSILRNLFVMNIRTAALREVCNETVIRPYYKGGVRECFLNNLVLST